MMNETAREVGLPLVGHAPVNLGFDVLLQARQSLAHMGMLGNIYFFPMLANFKSVLVTGAAFLVLVLVVIIWGATSVTGWWRKASLHRSPTLARVRAITGWAVLASLLALVSLALSLPSGPLFESITLRLFVTVFAFLIAIAAVLLVVLTARLWRDRTTSMLARFQASLVSIATLALALVLVIFWVPVSWRSTDSGIDRVAKRLRDAGISVQTTLVVYDAIGGPGRLWLTKDSAIDYLRADVQARWRAAQAAPPGYRYTDFMKKVAGALHRAGVPLMAGTDAWGFPLIAPGSSLHRELGLLTESGLTPYEAMRAATVVPASFLGKEKQFGTIATGKRADLLLIDGNPLEEVTRLRRPVGVMTRGRWLTREQLQQMLAAPAQGQ
jgi:hypothetical protein